MPPQSRRKDRRLDERWSKDTADGSRCYGFGLSANRGPLYSAAVPIYIRHAERVGVLYCVECGCCSGELGKGWVALTCNDPDGADEPRYRRLLPTLRRGRVRLPAGHRRELRLRLGTTPARDDRQPRRGAVGGEVARLSKASCNAPEETKQGRAGGVDRADDVPRDTGEDGPSLHRGRRLRLHRGEAPRQGRNGHLEKHPQSVGAALA